ncbi:MAG TPA: zinc ribbon domain-containing protein [Ktedonobacterales bacterium]
MGRTGRFIIGLMALLIGIGLTIGSFFSALLNGGHIYFIYYGLIIGGLGQIVWSFFCKDKQRTPTLRRSRKRKPVGYPSEPQIYGGMATLAAVPPGQCWNCGKRVKPEAQLCLHCGAAQRSSPNRLG